MANVVDLLLGNSPAAPDFHAAANEQMRAGRPDQQTDFASSKWTQGPDGSWSQSNMLNPEMRGLLDQLRGAAGQGLANGIGTGDDAFQQAQAASWQNAQANLIPQLQSRYDQQRSALANQGADLGNRALYGAATQDMNRDFDAGLAGAWGESMDKGLNAQNLTYQQNRDAYQIPFSLMGQMQGLTQMPGFQTAGNYQTAAGQQFNADQQRFQGQQAGLTGILQGAGDIAGSYFTGGMVNPFSFGGGGNGGQAPGGNSLFAPGASPSDLKLGF
jgi:hypothetical protein